MANALSWSYPSIVPYKVGNMYIEPTNHCNLRCIMCPHSKVKLKEGFMDWKLFLKVTNDIVSYNPETFIQLFYIGESLLHPRILDMVSYLKQNNLRIHLATNATLLDEKMSHELIELKLDFITFSFEGVDKKTYESIRRRSNYDTVMNNVLRFLSIKDDSKSDINVVIEIIEMDATKDKIPSFIKRFEGLPVNDIRIKPLLSWAGTMDCDKLTIKTPGRTYSPCNRPWRMLAVTWDGLFLPCCVDAKREYVLGDAHDDSVGEVWNGNRVQDLRRKIKFGQYSEIDLCRNCKDVEILSRRFTFPKVSRKAAVSAE